MEIQMVVKDRSRIAQAGLARPIQNERDYREAKALLGRTMRAARRNGSVVATMSFEGFVAPSTGSNDLSNSIPIW